MQGTRRTVAGQLKLLTGAPAIHETIRELVRSKLKEGALKLVYDLFQEECETLCGKGWSRKEDAKAHRGGHERGSLYLSGQRVKVRYPRIREGDRTRGVTGYQALRNFDALSEEVQRLLLRGVSTRDYSQAVEAIQEGTKLSAGTVSRAFARSSQKCLDEINGRDLSKYCLAALFFDGIEFAGVHVLVGMGITTEGKKVLLGLREGGSENGELVKDFLESLVGRGLALTEYFLVVLDGSKALGSVVKRMWGDRAVIQRCQIHKRRNVESYLAGSYHGELRRRMNAAYGVKEYAEAKRQLVATIGWLREICEQAARSLEEGLEETLTVHRLGLPDILRRTLSSTNAIESIFEGVRYRTNRVKRWRTGKGLMVSRWTASALLLIEKRLRKIRGYRLLPMLMESLKQNGLAVKGMAG